MLKIQSSQVSVWLYNPKPDCIMLQQQLYHTKKMESVGRLAGGMAHDFNNMLTGNLGYCDLVAERAETDKAVYDDVMEIKSAGMKSKNLIRQN